MHQHHVPAHSNGFTLVEMLVTVIVLALLAAVAVPSFTSTVQSNRVSTQANELLGLIQHARNEAVKRRTQVDVATSSAGNTGWTASSTVAGTDTPLRTIDRSQSALALSGDADFGFDAMGRRVPAGSHCIGMTAGQHSRYVLVRHSGQTRVLNSQGPDCP